MKESFLSRRRKTLSSEFVKSKDILNKFSNIRNTKATKNNLEINIFKGRDFNSRKNQKIKHQTDVFQVYSPVFIFISILIYQ